MSLLVSVNESVSMTPSRPTSRLPRACVARFKHFDKQTVAVCPCLFFSFFYHYCCYHLAASRLHNTFTVAVAARAVENLCFKF